jgi:hypothetical protein
LMPHRERERAKRHQREWMDGVWGWRLRLLTRPLLSGRHRWQGPSAWPSCQHCCQAAPQRPEDCRCPLRGPQHLRRVLPREAYVTSSVLERNRYPLEGTPPTKMEHQSNRGRSS